MPSAIDPEVAAPAASPAAGPRPERAGIDWPEPSARSRRFGLGAVLAVPFLANLVAICGIVQYQPQAKTSGLGLIHQVGILNGGQPYVDPNVGFNSYAFGHAAALLWLHGHVPWWDFNQGIGTPLAGSVQTAAFFPPTLLLALGSGSLWFHVCLEVLAGWACYALLRELRCSPFVAAVGGIAFELNGALAWITNAPANPVPFLPLLVLGVEWCVNAAGAKRRGGWVLLGVGVWLTIVSGFPEVAILNAALAVAWLVVRLVQRYRLALGIASRAAIGGIAGVLVAAPLLNSFARNLHLDVIGVHNAPIADLSMPRTGLAQLVAPYLFGGIFDNATDQVREVFGRVGGYTGTILLVLAVAGLFGRRERWMRILLGAWALLFLGYSYDFPVLHPLVTHIPGLLHIAVYRYSTSSVLFCMCVLAALFLDDLREATPLSSFLRMVPGIAVVLIIFLIGFFSTTVGRQWSMTYLPKWFWGSFALFVATMVALCAAAALMLFSQRRRWLRNGLGVLLALETFGFFEVPILAFPRNVTYDTTVVSYLRAHLGTQRYFTIGPVSPDFGAFYGVASLDLADLPVPKNWTTYVAKELEPCVFPWQFGNGPPLPGCPAPVYEFLGHAEAYEASGAKFFVIGSKNNLALFFQPNLHGGPATPDGAATMVLGVRAPSFFQSGRITGFDLRLPAGPPAGLATEICSDGHCATATPGSSSKYGTHFSLSAPLTLRGTATVTLTASNAAPVQVLTVPSVQGDPSTVTADGTVLPGRSAMLHFDYVASSIPRLVFASTAARVWLLPDPAPIVSAPGCRIAIVSVTRFTTTCAAKSTLTYRELSFPGWRVTVGGRRATITTAKNGVFQQVALPRGTSVVVFNYEPPGALYAWIAMALGILALLGGLLLQRRSPSRRAPPRVSPAIAARGSLLGGARPPGAVDPAPPAVQPPAVQPPAVRPPAVPPPPVPPPAVPPPAAPPADPAG